jgi:hypothetical protein
MNLSNLIGSVVSIPPASKYPVESVCWDITLGTAGTGFGQYILGECRLQITVNSNMELRIYWDANEMPGKLRVILCGCKGKQAALRKWFQRQWTMLELSCLDISTNMEIKEYSEL